MVKGTNTARRMARARQARFNRTWDGVAEGHARPKKAKTAFRRSLLLPHVGRVKSACERLGGRPYHHSPYDEKVPRPSHRRVSRAGRPATIPVPRPNFRSGLTCCPRRAADLPSWADPLSGTGLLFSTGWNIPQIQKEASHQPDSSRSFCTHIGPDSVQIPLTPVCVWAIRFPVSLKPLSGLARPRASPPSASFAPGSTSSSNQGCGRAGSPMDGCGR